MEMYKQIREYRKKAGLTQEQIAIELGVSTPAVNKWEKGSTYPDVTLLPALARLLNIDLNTLMCFKESLSQEDINKISVEVTDEISKEGFLRGFELASKKMKDYPNCFSLIYTLSIILEGSLLVSPLDVEQKNAYREQIYSLYERVAECEDASLRERATYMLASKYINNAELDHAQEMLDRLPDYKALDKRKLQADLYLKEGKKEEAAYLLEKILHMDVQNSLLILYSLSDVIIKEGNTENALRIADGVGKAVEAFGLWNYISWIIPLNIAITTKDKEKSLTALTEIIKTFETPWDMKESPLFEHMYARLEHMSAKHKKPEQEEKLNKKNLNLQFLPALLKELETNPDYDFLRDEPEFQSILLEYHERSR